MKQHYVPRVHLKFFAEQVKSEYFVDVYEIETKRIFRTNIKNVCAEKHFYTLDENQKVANDILSIEKIYSDWIEPMYRRAYDILTNRNITRITHIQHQEILIGILQMYTRNPDYLKKLISFHKEEVIGKIKIAKNKKIKGVTYLDEDFSFREYSEKEIINFIKEKTTKEFKEKHLIGTKEICEFHVNAKYEVSEIIDDGEFITGDNPLFFEDLINKDDFPLLKSKEFIFPLNRKFALRIFHDKTKKTNYIYRTGIPHGNAGIINDSILKNCSRFIIGSQKGFDGLFKIKKFLDDTSLELKMDGIKQILTKFESTKETEKTRKVMKFYLDRYEKNGTLTKMEEFNLFTKITEGSAQWKKDRLDQ